MGPQFEKILICLVLAYLLQYFVIKPNLATWLRVSQVNSVVYALSGALLGYLLIGQWMNWQVPLFMLLTNLVLDMIFHWPTLYPDCITVQNQPYLNQSLQSLGENGIANFSIELIVRTLMMVFGSALSANNPSVWEANFGMSYYGMVAIIAGWLVIGCVCGEWIGLFLKKQQVGQSIGLEAGGETIGFLERSIIFILLLLNAPTGIGLLITAKTIFRFGEINKSGDNRKEVEYILIGTLLSFFLGTVVSLLTMYISIRFCPTWSFVLLN
jgi:hypothetical protein